MTTRDLRLFATALLLFAVLVLRGQSQDTISALPLTVPAPADNPTTPAKVELGRLLFWDPVLSGSLTVSCATCHHPDFGYSDGLDLSIGVTGAGVGAARHFIAGSTVPVTRRNSPGLVNVGFSGLDEFGRVDPSLAQLFWDRRIQGLERQAFVPMRSFEEMRGTAVGDAGAVDAAVARVAAIGEYRQLFSQAFGGSAPVTADHLVRALASFQRTLVAVNTPFDRYMRGDTTALTPLQRRGMDAFVEARCINCHRGAMFSDFKAHALGIPDNPKLPESDSGANGSYAFRTPTLRNLSLTAPYMHNGTLPTLDAVLDFYTGVERGEAPPNPRMPNGQLAAQLSEVTIGSRRNEIIAFLGALDDHSYDRRKPERVPSGLIVGGD